MKPIRNFRILFVAFILILSLMLVACVRPLQDKDEVSPTDTPSEAAPGAQPGVVTPAPTPLTQPEGETGELPTTGTEQPSGEATSTTITEITYVVQPNDTLAVISGRYNVSVETLAAANGLAVDAALQPGQTIVIPLGEGVAGQPGEQPAAQPTAVPAQPLPTEVPAAVDDGVRDTTYVVQAGDNLFRIGLRYGCTVQQMAAYNGIANPHWINVGQVIQIPPSC